MRGIQVPGVGKGTLAPSTCLRHTEQSSIQQLINQARSSYEVGFWACVCGRVYACMHVRVCAFQGQETAGTVQRHGDGR